MRRFSGWPACLLGTLVGCAGAAASKDEPSAGAAGCIAGAQVECSCAAAQAGVAICSADGARFGACQCGGASAAPRVAGAAGPAGAPSVALPDRGDGALDSAAPSAASASQLARNARIAEVSLYQPVKIPLMQNGQAVENRPAPVIANKRALLRVFVETLPDYTPRDLVARLELSSADGTMPLTLQKRIAATSTEPELQSTINFELPEAFMSADLSYSVALEEVAGAAAAGTADAQARWPQDPAEPADLGVLEPGAFRVVVVPYRYMADGSGRLPATSDAEMDKYRAYLQKMYPASHIELSVHAPVDFQGTLGSNSGWSEWLDTHCAFRAKEAPDPKLFYYGMIAPRDSWKAYGGGIAGISNVPGPAANFGRCSVGIGFAGFAFVAAHELGHALGLEHAPCGTSGGPFPYADALVGSWGYDVASAQLVAPDKAHDLMSYCDPTFMSDYNYRRLFERIRYLNLQFEVLDGANVAYDRVLIDEQGRASMRGTLSFALPPGGPEETRPVVLLDEHGMPSGQSEGFFFPMSQGGAGTWLIAQTGARRVRIEGVGDLALY